MSSKDYVDQFKSEGTLERRGEFQIDRAKAREKMQKFQLPDPHSYVLEFVKAVTILGATEVHFGIDADEMRMTCNCIPLTDTELDNLYGAAFSKLDSERNRALRHLAIGLTAADALDLETVEIKTVGPEGGFLYRREDRNEDLDETPLRLEPGPQRTSIYLKQRFRSSHLIDFLRKFRGELAEMKHLREKARYARVRIHLSQEINERAPDGDLRIGQQVSFGITLPARFQIEVETKTESGLMGTKIRHPSEIRIIQHGVLIASHIARADLPFEAVVESNQLTTDMSQSAFVEDHAYRSLIQKLTGPTLTHLGIRTYTELPLKEWRKEPVNLSLHIVLERFVDHVLRRRLNGGISEDYQRFETKLEAARIWPVATPSEHSYASICEIREAGAIYVTNFPDIDVELPQRHPVLYSEGTPVFQPYGVAQEPMANFPIAKLARYLELEIVDVTDELQDRKAWVENRRRWQYQPPARTPEFEVEASLNFKLEGITCTMSIRADHGPSVIQWIKDSKSLASEQLAQSHIRGLAITIEGDIEPNERFDGPAQSPLNTQIVMGFLTHIPDLFETYTRNGVVRQSGAAVLIDYLDHLVRPQFLESLIQAAGLDLDSENVREQLSRKRPHYALEPLATAKTQIAPADLALHLVSHMFRDAEASVSYLKELARALGPIADAWLFEELDGTWLSLNELISIFEEQGKIYVIHERSRRTAHHPSFEHKPAKNLPSIYVENREAGRMIWSNDQVNRLLASLVGSNRAPDGMNHLLFHNRKRAFLKNEPLEYALADKDYLKTGEFVTPHGRFKIGMLAPQLGTQNSASIDVRYEGRRINHVAHTMRAGTFDVVLETRGLLPAASFDQMEDGPELEQLLDDVETKCVEVMQDWICESAKTYDAPGALSIDEERFWILVITAHQAYGGLDRMVVAQDEKLQDVTLSDLRRYSRGESIAFYLDSSKPLRELLPSQRLQILKVRQSTPIEDFGEYTWIDISETYDQVKTLQESRRLFLKRKTTPIRAEGIKESRASFETDTMRGEVRLGSKPSKYRKNSFNIWYCHESRRVEHESVVAAVPFGHFNAVVDSDELALNATFSKITGGKEAAYSMARRHAEESVIALCESWDTKQQTRNKRNRSILEDALAECVTLDDSNNPWPRACERLKSTKLFEMADGHLRSYDTLREIADSEGQLYWLFSVLHEQFGPDELYSVSPSSIVLGDPENSLDGFFDVVVLEDPTTYQAGDSPRIVSSIPSLRWKKAVETLQSSPRRRTSDRSAETKRLKTLESLRFSEDKSAIVAHMEDHFARVAKTRPDLGKLKLLQQITPIAGETTELARVRSGVLEMNLDHPVVHYAEDNLSDPVATAFLGSALLASITNPSHLKGSDLRAILSGYTRWMRDSIQEF